MTTTGKAAVARFQSNDEQRKRVAVQEMAQMTVLTLRRIREDRFEVTGPDIEPVTFKTRVEARDWCLHALPGLANPRGWRPQKGHTGGSGGYGRTG